MSDFLKLNSGQIINIKNIITKEKLPARWPVNKEKTVPKIRKILKKILSLKIDFENIINKEKIKKSNPTLLINGPFSGFLNGSW